MSCWWSTTARPTIRPAPPGGPARMSSLNHGAAMATHARLVSRRRAAMLLAFMDGDGSFVPGELAALLAPLLDGSADLVLGTRMRGGMAAGAMPPHQRFGNQLVARLMYRLYGLRLTDLGPFRVIRRDLLNTLDMREMTYGWPVEMIVKAARQGARIVELPISYRPRSAGVSKVGGTVRGTILATYRILRTTFRYALGGIAQQRRLRT